MSEHMIHDIALNAMLAAMAIGIILALLFPARAPRRRRKP